MLADKRTALLSRSHVFINSTTPRSHTSHALCCPLYPFRISGQLKLIAGIVCRVLLHQVMVNLEPTHPEEGKLEPPLRSAHNAFGCTCHEVSDTYSAMRINHYLGSKGDFFDRTSLYWEVRSASAVVQTSDRTIGRHASKNRNDDHMLPSFERTPPLGGMSTAAMKNRN